MSAMDDYLATLADEELVRLAARARKSPASGSSTEILNHLLLSNLRQEALLARLVEALPGQPPVPSRPASTPRR